MLMGLIPAGFGMLTLSKLRIWTFLKSMQVEFVILKLLVVYVLLATQLTRSTETSSLEQVLKTIEAQDCKHAYILATYTAMLEFRELLANRQLVRKEMN